MPNNYQSEYKGAQIDNAITKINDIATTSPVPEYRRVNVSTLTGATAMNEFSGSALSTRLMLSPYEVYDSVCLYAQKDFNIYISGDDMEGQTYTSICVIENAGEIYQEGNNYYIDGTSGTGVRYRNIDNNMPTEEHPLLIKAGSCVIFTIYKANGNWFYYIDSGVSYTLNDDVNLGTKQLSQAKSYIENTEKKPLVQYKRGAGTGGSVERLEIFIPTVSGYIFYNFVRSKQDNRNLDVWRLDLAYSVDDSLVSQFALTDQGEWEAAISLNISGTGFIGGYAHGDEIFTGINFFIDGKSVNETSLTELTKFDELKIVQTSNLYNPTDHTTVICEHGSEHIFNKNGIELNQNLVWKVDITTSWCYMAMFPPAKFGSDKVYFDSEYAVETLPASQYANNYYNVKSLTIYNDTNGFMGVFEQPISKEGLTGERVVITDNNNPANNYNKCYYVITTGATVETGDIWKTKTLYKLSINS